MAKLLIILLSISITALFVVDASIYRTSTVVIGDEEIRVSGSCREQIEQQQQLSHCQYHIMEEIGRRPYRRHDANTHHAKRCCQQLRRLDTQCQCRGLVQAVQQRQQEEELSGEEVEESYRAASELLRLCDLQTLGCDFRQSEA